MASGCGLPHIYIYIDREGTVNFNCLKIKALFWKEGMLIGSSHA